MKKESKRLRLSPEEVEMVNEMRGKELDNLSGNTALRFYRKFYIYIFTKHLLPSVTQKKM